MLTEIEPLAIKIGAVADLADAVPHHHAETLALSLETTDGAPLNVQPRHGDDIRLPDRTRGVAHPFEQSNDVVIGPDLLQGSPSLLRRAMRTERRTP